MDMMARKHLVITEFEKRFGCEPRLWTRAPGRVDLMGSHTDYNLGYVLTMTIDRDTWIAATPRDDRKVEIVSLNMAGGGVFNLDDITRDEQSPWTNYVRGVARFMQAAGCETAGFNGLIHSTVPFGSGLSSSAAIEMATVEMFQLASGCQIDPIEKALIGQRAENKFVGVNTGILDQYSSTFGREGCALLLDCRDITSRTMAIAHGLRVVVCDTRTERSLTGTEYDERRAQCEQGVRILSRWDPAIKALRDVSMALFEAHEADLSDVVARRCRFILEENQRVLDLAAALPTGDRARLGRLLVDSYNGARDLYELTVPAMEAMMDAMMSGPGVVGARQAGAGFGGCMVALVEEAQVGVFTEHVKRTYQESAGIEPYVYSVMPTAGAGPLIFAE